MSHPNPPNQPTANTPPVADLRNPEPPATGGIDRDRAARAEARLLSNQLTRLACRLRQERVCIDDLVEVFRGRTLNLLLILLALPFLQPIPLPLLSTAFGAVIALIGLTMAFRSKPWVPDRIASRELPPGLLPRLLEAGARVTSVLERHSKPRWVTPSSLRGFHRTSGLLICLSGGLLLLPIPVPLSNLLPAAAVVVFATASLRRDGLCFLAGCGVLAIAIGFFGALCVGGSQLATWLMK